MFKNFGIRFLRLAMAGESIVIYATPIQTDLRLTFLFLLIVDRGTRDLKRPHHVWNQHGRFQGSGQNRQKDSVRNLVA